MNNKISKIFSDTYFLAEKLHEIASEINHEDAYYLRESATSLVGLYKTLLDIEKNNGDPLRPTGGSSQSQVPRSD